MSLWTDFLGCEIRWVDVRGVPTRVLSAGQGERTTVLLHGRGGHLESWRANVSALAQTQRVVAFDLLGHGLTGRHCGGYSVDDLTAHAEATLDALEISGALLCGQSLGGWVAARLALRRADLARALAMIVPAGLQSEAQRLADPVTAAAYEKGGRAFEEPSLGAVRDRLEGLVCDRAAIDDELVQTRRLLYWSPEARAVHRAVRAADNNSSLLTPEALGCLELPALVLHGEHANTPLEVAQRAAEQAGARLVVVSDTKQWPQLERADEVNELLTKFAFQPEVLPV